MPRAASNRGALAGGGAAGARHRARRLPALLAARLRRLLDSRLRRLGVEPADHLVGARQIGRVRQAHQHHLGGRQRAARGLDLGNAFEQHLPGAREHADGELLGKAAPALAFGLGEREIVGDRRHDFDAGHEMGELGEIGQHHRGIGAGVVLVAQLAQRRRQIAAHHRLEQVDGARPVGQPQHLPHVLAAHQTGRVGDGLIEQGERIAHRTLGGARDQSERLRLDRDLLLRRDAAQVPHQHVCIDAPQIEALAARQHRDRHLAGLGGGEHELGVRRRLFQRLEQRVEGLGREHVHFIEDVDLVARAHGGVADRIVDLAHVLHAVVRGGVHLDDVGMPALHDGLAVNPDLRHMDGGGRRSSRPAARN